MSRYIEFDPDRLDLVPFSEVPHTVSRHQFASAPRAGASFVDFWNSLPGITAGNAVRTVVRRIVRARHDGRAIVAACGAHVVKCGLAPTLITLMREGFITALAVNGATAIHDAEVALFGTTSEDVAGSLSQGRFGMAAETAAFFNAGMASAIENGEGAGEALGRALQEQQAPYRDDSLLAAAYQLEIPVTVHVALGTDIVHMHANASGAATGEASMRDFRILTAAMRPLSDGGVLLNIGSAVILPEVLLKAIACLRNSTPAFTRFLGVNLDMIQHYRANEQVVRRVESIGGEGISLTGHHELLIPLLAFAVMEEWSADVAEPRSVGQTEPYKRNGSAIPRTGAGEAVPAS